VIDALDSVVNQQYKNIQLIVVDDCSTDKSKTKIAIWINNYPSAKFVENTVNLGITKSFNNAFKLAKGDYIIDLAADDILTTECVTLQLKAFNDSAYKNLGLVYGNVMLINEQNNFLKLVFPQNENGSLLTKIPTGNIYNYIVSNIHSVCSVSALIKKEVFDTLNGYDEKLSYEDLDFWIRASRLYDFDFINTPIVKKRVLENSLGGSFYKKNIYFKKINHSTYSILQKTFLLNKNKSEHIGLLNRVFVMSKIALKTTDIMLFFKYLFLITKIVSTILFKFPMKNSGTT